MVKFSHTDPGTTERLWQGAGFSTLERVDLGLSLGSGGHLVVAAAHPDDESLGAGGLIHSALRAGATVHVLLCSAGEASHPDSPTHSRASLSGTRLEEFAKALQILAEDSHGPTPTWKWLALPDGDLLKHRSEIETRLLDACRNATALAAPLRHDGHIDHETLGELAAKTAKALDIELFEYPVWYWHWAEPNSNSLWRSWNCLELDAVAANAKAAAVACHVSQVSALSGAKGDEALLSKGFLEHFHRDVEILSWTPNTAGSAANAAQRFDALYRRSADPWNSMDSSYEAAKRVATMAALGKKHYGQAMEIGCSIGTLTRCLASRCSELLALDASAVAVSMAQRLLADLPNVQIRQAILPGQWPSIPEGVDLVVLSEVGYFLTADELEEVLEKTVSSLSLGGELLLCHWLHPVKGWPLDGAEVHGLARRVLGVAPRFSYWGADYALEVFGGPQAGHE